MQLRFLISLIGVLGTTSVAMAQGDTSPSPSLRVFSSSNGRWAFKVTDTPKEKTQTVPAIGTLLEWNRDGTERVIWKRPLVNVPLRALIFDGPPLTGDYKDELTDFVVTIGSWNEEDKQHALVIYDALGVVKEYSWEELLTKEELQRMELIQRTEPRLRPFRSHYWFNQQHFKFIVPLNPDQLFGATHPRPRYNYPELEIQLESGRHINIHLARPWGTPQPTQKTRGD